MVLRWYSARRAAVERGSESCPPSHHRRRTSGRVPLTIKRLRPTGGRTRAVAATHQRRCGRSAPGRFDPAAQMPSRPLAPSTSLRDRYVAQGGVLGIEVLFGPDKPVLGRKDVPMCAGFARHRGAPCETNPSSKGRLRARDDHPSAKRTRRGESDAHGWAGLSWVGQALARRCGIAGGGDHCSTCARCPA